MEFFTYAHVIQQSGIGYVSPSLRELQLPLFNFDLLTYFEYLLKMIDSGDFFKVLFILKLSAAEENILSSLQMSVSRS